VTFRLEQDLGFLLARTHRAMRRRLMSQLEPLGVTYGQFRVLNALCQQDHVPQVALASRVAAHKASLTRMLERLERTGLVSREADPDDARVQRVSLTEKGRRVQSRVIPLRDLALDAAVEGLDEEEVRELERLLNRIYDNVK
jgi:DNA-binding MarR family transcriptional regulator